MAQAGGYPKVAEQDPPVSAQYLGAPLAGLFFCPRPECQADEVAFVYLRPHNIPSHLMQDLLGRVGKAVGRSAAHMGYLATHRATSERDRR